MQQISRELPLHSIHPFFYAILASEESSPQHATPLAILSHLAGTKPTESVSGCICEAPLIQLRPS